MNTLCIDMGSYSLKLIEFDPEKRGNNKFVKVQELVLADLAGRNSGQSTEEIQALVLRTYLNEAAFEGKIVFQIPNSYMTHRFLNLPVTVKKKAEQMIPFQLEDDLPFPTNELHYSSLLLKGTKDTYALVGITQLLEFERYFKGLEGNRVLGHMLTAEVGLIQTYATLNESLNAYAIIDIGHETTKVYGIGNKKVLSTYSSFVAGRRIEETIAQTYKISIEDAIIYKHENSYFLTSPQMADVTEEQKAFAKLMDQIVSPLINDIQKWLLGLRVSHGIRPDKIFLIGGTSNIKNIDNYFTEGLKIESLVLSVPQIRDFKDFEMRPSQRHMFSLSYLMYQSQLLKLPMINFRTGSFVAGATEDIPLHSFAFVGLRTMILSAIIILTCFIQKTLLEMESKQMNDKILQAMKNPTFAVSANDQRRFLKAPEGLATLMQKKLTEAQQESKRLRESAKIQGLTPFFQIHQNLKKNPLASLISFQSIEGEALATFESDKMEELEKIKELLTEQRLKNADINVNETQKQLTAKFLYP